MHSKAKSLVEYNYHVRESEQQMPAPTSFDQNEACNPNRHLILDAIQVGTENPSGT